MREEGGREREREGGREREREGEEREINIAVLLCIL